MCKSFLNRAVLFGLLLCGMFAPLYYAHAMGNDTPQFELVYQLPRDWKLAIRGELRDKLVRKYTSKSESIFMWTSMLTITQYYDRDIKDLQNFIRSRKLELKELCDASNFVDNPGAGLSVDDGVYLEYSCPFNKKVEKGQMGLLAYIQGVNGLYEVLWLWQGPSFRPDVLPMDYSKIPSPVSDLEMDQWYRFFATIRLKPVKKHRWE